MKNTTETTGIKIDKEVENILLKAIERAGSIRKLAKICSFTPMNLCRWTGTAEGQKVECIDWPIDQLTRNFYAQVSSRVKLFDTSNLNHIAIERRL